jgi:hypothetical protein
MPDSFPPPPWGSAPFDERDLDALLAAGTPLTGSTGPSGDTGPSGHAAAVPPALRQVADTLSALRAAPSPAELRGEAAIRAEFRAAVGTAASATTAFAVGTASAVAPAASAVGTASAAGGGTVPTAVLPLAGPGRGRHSTRKHGARKHGRRDQVRPGQDPRPRRGRLTAGMFAAALVVIAVAAAYSGQLPGPAQRLAHDALAAPSARQSGATQGTSPRVDARSARPVISSSHPATVNSAPPAPDVSSSASPRPAATPASLCEAFYQSLEHRSFRQAWWNTPAYKKVSIAAGGPQHVPGYCAKEWAKLRPHDYPQVPVVPWIGNHASGNLAPGNAAGNQAPGNMSGSQSSSSQSSSSQDSSSQDSENQAPGDLAPATPPSAATQAAASPAAGKSAAGDTAPGDGTSDDQGNGTAATKSQVPGQLPGQG